MNPYNNCTKTTSIGSYACTANLCNTFTHLMFELISDDIVDHLEKNLVTKDTDCENVQMGVDVVQPKSRFIGNIVKTDILPPSTNTVIFSLSQYTGPSENRFDYIESDEDDECDSEVVASTQSSEDDVNASKDIDDDESDTTSLVPLSRSDELELARMVCVYNG